MVTLEELRGDPRTGNLQFGSGGFDNPFGDLTLANAEFGPLGQFMGRTRALGLQTIEQQLAAQRANPFLRALRNQVQGLQGQVLGESRQLKESLIGGALGSTAGLQAASAQAARQAGGGRGGLAFSGGSSLLAARGASQGASAQSAALSGALAQGSQATIQGLLGAGQVASGFGAALSGQELGFRQGILGQTAALQGPFAAGAAQKVFRIPKKSQTFGPFSRSTG